MESVVHLRFERVLFSFSVDILINANSQNNESDTKIDGVAMDLLSFLDDDIHNISQEIEASLRKGLGQDDVAEVLLTKFLKYSDTANLMILLTTFAMNQGIWVLAQIYASNPNDISAPILKKLDTVLHVLKTYKSTELHIYFLAITFFEQWPKESSLYLVVLAKMFKSILAMTQSILELQELPNKDLDGQKDYSAAMDDVATDVSQTIKAILACAKQISELPKNNYIISREVDAYVLSVTTLGARQETLATRIQACNRYIEDTKIDEAFQIPGTHTNNVEALQSLMHIDDENVFDMLKGKYVLLLISNLDNLDNELTALNQIYRAYCQWLRHEDIQYEVLWLPMYENPLAETLKNKFESFKTEASWNTIRSSSWTNAKFIKEVWHFKRKTIVVVLDPQGRVVHPNAIHMMWIWGSKAFPFTRFKERDLWKEQTWKLDLIVDGIDPTIWGWIEERKHIFLYGGGNIEWARKFTNKTDSVAEAAGIAIEMVYVGKSTKREQQFKVIEALKKEKLGNYWENPNKIQLFWNRIRHMLYSLNQQGRVDDRMYQDIKRLLSYDTAGGWAMLSEGNDVVTLGTSSTIFKCLEQFNSHWKPDARKNGFGIAFKDHHDKLQQSSHRSTRLEFDSTSNWVPKKMQCPNYKCLRRMKRIITYECYHNDPLAAGEVSDSDNSDDDMGFSLSD